MRRCSFAYKTAYSPQLFNSTNGFTSRGRAPDCSSASATTGSREFETNSLTPASQSASTIGTSSSSSMPTKPVTRKIFSFSTAIDLFKPTTWWPQCQPKMVFFASDINQKVFQYTTILKRAKDSNNIRRYINYYGNRITCPQNDDMFKTIMYSLMIHPVEYQQYGHYDDWYQLYHLPEQEYDFKFYERDDLETVVTHHLQNQSKFISDLKEADIVVTDESIQRYEKFIRLFKKKHETVIVPTFDIDVIWHAHMLTSSIYVNDMQNVLGRILDHDDGLDKSKLKVGFASTEKIWEKEYNERYRVEKKKDYPGCSNGSGAFTATHYNSSNAHFFSTSTSNSNLHPTSVSADIGSDSCGSDCGGCGCSG